MITAQVTVLLERYQPGRPLSSIEASGNEPDLREAIMVRPWMPIPSRPSLRRRLTVNPPGWHEPTGHHAMSPLRTPTRTG